MEKIITLTDKAETKIYLNVLHIVSYSRFSENYSTHLYTSNGHEFKLIETPEEITKLINK